MCLGQARADMGGSLRVRVAAQSRHTVVRMTQGCTSLNYYYHFYSLSSPASWFWFIIVLMGLVSAMNTHSSNCGVSENQKKAVNKRAGGRAREDCGPSVRVEPLRCGIQTWGQAGETVRGRDLSPTAKHNGPLIRLFGHTRIHV